VRRLLFAVIVLVTAGASRAADDAGIRAGDAVVVLPEGPGRGIQGTPAVAFGGGQYLVAWREGWHGKGGSARVYAARVSAEGKVLDAKGIEVAPVATPGGPQERPRVAFAGGVFLVVWQDLRNGKDYDVLAARVDAASGKVLDREPLRVAAGPRTQALPDVASHGNGFLVVWQGLAGEEADYRGYAAPVSADGVVGPAVETGLAPQPRVAWNGERFLGAAAQAHGTFTGNVRVVPLDTAGKPQGKEAVALGGTKAAVFSVTGVPGRGWVVVSHRSPPDPWGWGGPGAMRAARVNGEGKVETSEKGYPQGRLANWLDVGVTKGDAPTWPWGESAVAFDGAHAVVVWQRHHLAGEKRTNFENCDLIAARVDGTTSFDAAGVPVAATPAEERRPALASDGAGGLLLAYEREVDEDHAAVVVRTLRTSY